MNLFEPSYLFALFLTLILETIVGFIFGYRTLLAVLTIFLVNLFSHPLANYILWSHYVLPTKGNILVVELFIVLVEWGLLIFALRQRKMSLLILAVAMNGVSFISGRLLLDDIFYLTHL